MRSIILGTGPSLAIEKPAILELKKRGWKLFGCNNTFQDFPLDCWLSCDPSWHAVFGKVEGAFDKWHWDAGVCSAYGYRFVKGIWHTGLWLEDDSCISLNHGSAPQLINLAARQYRSTVILLAGHDFSYKEGQPRHYFTGLSDQDGEYPQPLRKYSEFDKKGRQYDLLTVYKEIADTPGRPEILNCTQGSRLPWFEFRRFEDFL